MPVIPKVFRDDDSYDKDVLELKGEVLKANIKKEELELK